LRITLCITHAVTASNLSTCAKPVDKTQAAISAALTQMKSTSAMSCDTPKIPRKLKWIRLGMIQSILVIALNNNAYAINNNDIEKEKYKLYSHIKLTNHRQYLCLEQLWYLESKWNPRADNKHSTAYGIPQLLKLKVNNPYMQIDAGLKYISHRYGTPCKALAYHLKTGHY
jgi:hypothetical protein